MWEENKKKEPTSVGEIMEGVVNGCETSFGCNNINDSYSEKACLPLNKKSIERELLLDDYGETVDHDYIISKLTKINIKHEDAKRLAIEYSTNYLLLNDYIDLIALKSAKKTIGNPYRYLITAIKEDYELDQVYKYRDNQDRTRYVKHENSKQSAGLTLTQDRVLNAKIIRAKAFEEYERLSDSNKETIKHTINVRMCSKNPTLYQSTFPKSLFKPLYSIGFAMFMGIIYEENGFSFANLLSDSY